MIEANMIKVEAGAPSGLLHHASPVRPAARRLLRLPGLRALKPFLRRAMDVAEPAGQLVWHARPERETRPDGNGLTVLSANLWHDWPRFRRIHERLEAFAAMLVKERVDVVLLQEVARTAWLRVDEWLRRELGMAYVYSRANGHAGGIGFEEGLAVLSRFPLSAPRLQQLGPGRNPFVRRLALGAAIQTPFGDLLTFSVHLGLRRGQNARQLAHLREWVTQLAGPAPALIGGDFNAGEGSLQISRAQAAWMDTFRSFQPQSEGATHELRWPWGGLIRRARLDYIFLHPGRGNWKVLEARHIGTETVSHSDHCAVLARLEPVSHAN